MGWYNATRGQSIVMVANGAIRAVQVLVAILTIIWYIPEKGYWLDHGLPAKINFEFVLSAFAIITGLVLGLIPFKLSYRPVALACPWDFIMFLMYAAIFGYMKSVGDKIPELNTFDTWKFLDPGNFNLYVDHGRAMRRNEWVDLAGMILFLVSAIMGAVLLWVGRKNARGGGTRHSAV